MHGPEKPSGGARQGAQSRSKITSAGENRKTQSRIEITSAGISAVYTLVHGYYFPILNAVLRRLRAVQRCLPRVQPWPDRNCSPDSALGSSSVVAMLSFQRFRNPNSATTPRISTISPSSQYSCRRACRFSHRHRSARSTRRPQNPAPPARPRRMPGGNDTPRYSRAVRHRRRSARPRESRAPGSTGIRSHCSRRMPAGA